MPSRYIIDTNVLIQYPQVLSRIGNKKIVIPASVIQELLSRGRGEENKEISNLVISAGVEISRPTDKFDHKIIQSYKNAQMLSVADFDIVRIAINYAELQGYNVPCVVTADKGLSSIISTFGIESITGSEFLSESKNKPINKEIQDTAEKVVISQKRFLFSSFLIGSAVSIISYTIFKNINILISTITIWGTMVGLPIIGIVLFWYREKFRLSYGTFEFCVGIIMSCYVFFPNFNYSMLGVTDGIQVIGGLYVMVRGLDNIGKGILGTRIESIWSKIF